MDNNGESRWFAFVPAIFVLLWATGFIGAKYGLPHAGPLAFLSYRFGIVIVILLVAALVLGAPWPARRIDRLHAMVSGMLIHGIYLGGVFIAIDHGLSAGVSALIVGLQPLLTAVLSKPLLGERITFLHWLGLIVGLVGVTLVLLPRMQGGEAISTFSLIAVIVALFAITLGTIYQKAFAVKFDLRTGGVLQYLGALIPTVIVAYYFEDFEVDWTLEFVGAMAWLVLVLSIGAISLLMLIIRHGEVSKVASLFYLVPPVTVVMAYFLFDEKLTLLQGAGITLTVLAVWVTSRIPRASSSSQ
jgi:drug/metabolite transporter (DMT)-like permease